MEKAGLEEACGVRPELVLTEALFCSTAAKFLSSPSDPSADPCEPTATVHTVKTLS